MGNKIYDRVLIVFPAIETFNKFDESKLLRFRKGLKNIVRFFKEQGEDVYGIASDTCLVELFTDLDIKYLNVLAPSDRFALDKLGYSEAYIHDAEDVDSNIYRSIGNKVKMLPGISTEERLDNILKREKYAGNMLIRQEPCVLTFGTPSNSVYTVKSKDGDKRVVLRVELNCFTMSSTFSNHPIALKYMLNTEQVLNTIDNWYK